MLLLDLVIGVLTLSRIDCSREIERERDVEKERGSVEEGIFVERDWEIRDI